jgi:hypothetical protein
MGGVIIYSLRKYQIRPPYEYGRQKARTKNRLRLPRLCCLLSAVAVSVCCLLSVQWQSMARRKMQDA